MSRATLARGSMSYEPSYDGLRAVAVLSVILFHTGRMPGGANGVSVFFVLSGYLITRLLLQEEERAGRIDLRRFYIGRALRLMPALYAMIFIVSVVSIGLHKIHDQLLSSLFSGAYIMNLNRAFQWGPEINLGHTWSLAMEEQFYLVWPLFLILVPRKMRWSATISAVAAISLWRLFLTMRGANVERLYNGFDTHAEGILIGCIAAFFMHVRRKPSWLEKYALIPATILVPVLAAVEIYTPIRQNTINIITEALSAWLIIALPASATLRMALSWRPAVYIGRISYGAYLWHYPIATIGAARHMHFISPLTIVGGLLMGILSYELLEKYFLKLKASMKPSSENSDPVDHPISFVASPSEPISSKSY